MTIAIYDSLTVADIAAIKALTGSTIPKRVNKLFLLITDTGDGTPDLVKYNASSTADENLPYVIEPTDGVGRWFSTRGIPEMSSGGYVPLSIKTANYSITTNGERIAFNGSTGANLICSLPTNPQIGWEAEILWIGGDQVTVGFGGAYYQNGNGIARLRYYNRGGKLLYIGNRDGDGNNYWQLHPTATNFDSGAFGE